MFDDLNPNVIIVLVVMVVGAIRWFIEQIRGVNRNQDEAPTSEFEDLYEEARLEILERQAQFNPDPEEVSRHLGTAAVIPTPGIPAPRPLVTTPPPIPVTASPPPTRNSTTAPRTPRSLTAEEKKAAAAFEARSGRVTRHRKRSSTSANIRRLLSSPTSAQDAIVLADILGPPKGNRS